MHIVHDFLYHFLPSRNEAANPAVGLNGGGSPTLALRQCTKVSFFLAS